MPLSHDALNYQATIEDPKAFSRSLEKNAQLLEFKCVEFVEELMYGLLRKQSSR